MRVRIHSDRRRNVERARQIIDHRVDEILHALVLERGAADDRHEFVRDRLATDARLQHFRRDLFLFENRFGDFVVDIGNLLDQIA